MWRGRVCCGEDVVVFVLFSIVSGLFYFHCVFPVIVGVFAVSDLTGLWFGCPKPILDRMGGKMLP